MLAPMARSARPDVANSPVLLNYSVTPLVGSVQFHGVSN